MAAATLDAVLSLGPRSELAQDQVIELRTAPLASQRAVITIPMPLGGGQLREQALELVGQRLFQNVLIRLARPLAIPSRTNTPLDEALSAFAAVLSCRSFIVIELMRNSSGFSVADVAGRLGIVASRAD